MWVITAVARKIFHGILKAANASLTAIRIRVRTWNTVTENAMKTETKDPIAAVLKDMHGFRMPVSKTSATRTHAKIWPIHTEHASRNTTKPTLATIFITVAAA
jgi:hypothetical protein